MEEEKEVYEIIASMPIDFNRINVLRDITFEAQLLMRSRFVKKVTINFDEFQRIHEYSDDKEILLTTELDSKRFIIYLEHGKIVSSAMSDPEKGTRVVGLRPLATLILASKNQPIVFKLFEIHAVEEDRTRETPPRVIHEIVEEKKPPTMALERGVRETLREEKEKPIIVVFAEKLVEFRNRARKIVEDTAPAYGCKLIDLKIGIGKGVITIELVLKKKGLFGKCRVNELKRLLENDLSLILTMLDINLPLKVEARLIE